MRGCAQVVGRRLNPDWLAFERDPHLWLDYRQHKPEGDDASPDFVHVHDTGRRLWISHLKPGNWLLERLQEMDALPADRKVLDVLPQGITR